MTPDRKARLAAACTPLLHSLAERCTGLLWASVSTQDGIEVASLGGHGDEKLSVMAGTMHALADGIMAEAALGACHNIMLDAERGRVVILSIPHAEGLVLAGMAQPDTSLGMLLVLCSNACEEIGGATAALAPVSDTPFRWP